MYACKCVVCMQLCKCEFVYMCVKEKQAETERKRKRKNERYKETRILRDEQVSQLW